jgi:hypothetical protein
MPQALPSSSLQIRVIRRQSIRPALNMTLRPVRPSLLEKRLNGDPWILAQGDERFSLRFNDWQLAEFGGAPLDLPSLNRLLERLRNRPPRRRR